MPKSKRGVRSERVWLDHEQEVERARWLLLAALTRENPGGGDHLIQAAPHYAEMLAKQGDLTSLSSAFIRVLFWPRLKGHLEAHVDSDGFVSYPFGGVNYKADPLSLSIGRWAANNQLLQVNGYSYEIPGRPQPIKGPFYWLGQYAGRILHAGPSSAEDVIAVCQECALHVGISGFKTWQPDKTNLPYPEKPLLIFVPSLQSKKEFLAEALEKLDQFADDILIWHEANGSKVAEERQAEKRHFSWLALHVLHGWDATDIAIRCDVDESTVDKALFDPGGLAHLTGIRQGDPFAE